MKKIRAVLTAALMVLTLSACGADSQHTNIQNKEMQNTDTNESANEVMGDTNGTGG